MITLKPAKTLTVRQMNALTACVFEFPDILEADAEQGAKPYDEEGYVALDQDEAVGVLLWRVVKTSGSEDGRYLSVSLGVAPRARGRGYGSTLAGELTKILEQHKAMPVRIDADSANKAAHHLAQKIGLHVEIKRLRYKLPLAEKRTLSQTNFRVEQYDGTDSEVAEKIAALHGTAFRHHSPVGEFTARKIQDFSTKTRHAMLCVWDGDRLAAFAGLARHGTEGWVYWIAAGRRWWGRGASDILSMVIINTSIDLGCTSVDAVADEKNFPSRSLMERFGMSVVSTITRYTNHVNS